MKKTADYCGKFYEVTTGNIHDNSMPLPSGSTSSFKSTNSNECLMENLMTSLVKAKKLKLLLCHLLQGKYHRQNDLQTMPFVKD